MSIIERAYKPNSLRLYCPNCTRHLPLEADPFTFCSARCRDEFNNILTLSNWEELDEELEEREGKEN